MTVDYTYLLWWAVQVSQIAVGIGVIAALIWRR